MQTIKELVSTIKQKKEEAGQSMDKLDPHTRRVRAGKAKRAREDLKELYMRYRKLLASSSVFMLVTGTHAKEFVDVAREDFACFAVEADSFYKSLLDQVPKVTYMNKIANSSLFDHFSAKFEDRATQIDIVGYPAFVFKSKYKKKLSNYDDALDLVKRAWNETVGSETAVLDAIDKVAEEAVNKDYSAPVCPIILYTQDEKLVEEMLEDVKKSRAAIPSQSVFVISVGKVGKDLKKLSFASLKNGSKDSVEEVLKKIKGSVLR